MKKACSRDCAPCTADILVAGPQAEEEQGPLDQASRRHGLARDAQQPLRWCAPIPRPAARCCSSQQVLHGGLRGHDPGREQALARLPVRQHGNRPEFTFRVIAGRRFHRLLGQSQHPGTSRSATRPSSGPPAAADPDQRRQAGVMKKRFFAFISIVVGFVMRTGYGRDHGDRLALYRGRPPHARGRAVRAHARTPTCAT